MQTLAGVHTPERDDDPFGLHRAVAAASTTPPLAERVRARLERWLLVLVAVLPLPVLAVATAVAVVDRPNPPATVAASLLWIWTLAFVAHQLDLVARPGEEREVGKAPGVGRRGSVLVIGAGPVGLAVVKECAAAGRLCWRVLRGPMTGTLYRLEGPGAAPVARDTVLALRGTHPLSEMITLTGLYFWTWPVALLHRGAAWSPHNRFL